MKNNYIINMNIKSKINEINIIRLFLQNVKCIFK